MPVWPLLLQSKVTLGDARAPAFSYKGKVRRPGLQGMRENEQKRVEAPCSAEVLGKAAVVIFIFSAQKTSLSQANAKHKICGITNIEPGVLPRRHSVTEGPGNGDWIRIFSVYCLVWKLCEQGKTLNNCGALWRKPRGSL